MVSQKEISSLRALATRYMEHANNPVMEERKRQWGAIKDLKAEKPMILVETCMLPDYISESELFCEDPYLRNVEKSIFELIRHADEIGDDIVVDPYFRIPWVLEISDYGVPIEAYHAKNTIDSDLAYSFHFAIKTPEDVNKLRLRTRRVNREETNRRRELLEEIMGDILPIKIGGFDPFNPNPGYHPWLGNLYGGLTMDLFKLLGNDNLLYWVYDHPDSIHKMMEIIRDDRINHFKYLEKEGLLYLNNDTWNPCPCSYGFTSSLPGANYNEESISLKNCWGWTDSQESAPISPKMFNELFLPYIAEVSKHFGLVYYGCCEAIHERFEYIEKAIPNLRAVSVSGWSDLFKMGELLGKRYVYSRKPTPAYISGDYPDWEMLENDVKDTLKAARDCNLEFCYRDIYTINGDRSRLSRWVEMTRSLMDC